MIEIMIDHEQHIKGLSEDEIAQVKEDLTFDNPKYAQAMKYSGYATTTIPESLYYYSFARGILNVPLGYDFKTEKVVRYTDTRVVGKKLKFAPFLLKLRPTQIEARDAFLDKNINYLRNGVIQLETGKGKTVTSLAIVSMLQLKTLIIVHKDDLFVSWSQDIKKCFGDGLNIGIIKAGKREVGDYLTIATLQTLNRLSEEELKKLYSTFGIIIHDEVHCCPSTQFSISSKFNARYKIGLSATPERNDGLTQVISLYFGGTCYASVYDEETEEDILPVDVIIRNVKEVFFDPVFRISYRRGTHIISKLTRLVGDKYDEISYRLKDNEIRLSDIRGKRPKITYQDVEDHVVLNETYGTQVLTDVMAEYNAGRSIVMFISKKEHCEIYYANLHALIGDKVQLYYGDSKESNEELMRRAEEREALITITTIKKGTEGTNVKAWEVAFLVSSMNNGKGVEQAVGRVRRTKEGKIRPCKVYDYRVPNVMMMAHHGTTRDARYKKMKCNIISENGGRKLLI